MPVFPKIYKKYCDRKLNVVTGYLEKEDKILDAGCGDKNHPYIFLELAKKFDLTGVDIGNPWHNSIIRGDISCLNFADRSFDVVLCLDVLEHINDWKKVFHELIRVARKKVIISVPTTESRLFFEISQFLRKLFGVNNIIFAGHFRDYFPDDIMALAENEGCHCELAKIQFATPFFSPFLLKSKMRYGGIFVITKTR